MTFDVRFADAVHAAAAGDKASLVEWLKSDKPLQDGERRLLAALIAGDLDRRAGKPNSKVAEAIMRAAAVEYLDRTDGGEKGESVADEICDRLGIGRSTFLAFLKRTKKAIEQLDAMGLNGRSVMSPK